METVKTWVKDNPIKAAVAVIVVVVILASLGAAAAPVV